MSSVEGTSALVERLCAAISEAQDQDLLAPVTVAVPSPYARVQLRRAVAARRGVCNVSFRTMGELVSELARPALGPSVRVATPRMVDEALRQVLLGDKGEFGALAHSAPARRELGRVLEELWRGGPELRRRVSIERGSYGAALAALVGSVSDWLAERRAADQGRVLVAAASAPVQIESIGTLIRWLPRPPVGLEAAVLAHVEETGIAVRSMDADGEPLSVGQVVECADADEEVRVAVRAVLRALHDGVPLWRQAIIHPPAERYRRSVHQQLAASGVPRCGPSPLNLAHSATGRALLGLLALAEGSWRRDEVVRWLSSAPLTIGPGDSRVPASRWDDVSARAGVVEGLEQWRSRLDRFARGAETERRPPSPHDAGTARSLLAFVEDLAAELDTDASSWSEWSVWAGSVLDRHLHPADATRWPNEEHVSARRIRELLADLAGLDAVGPSADLVAFRHAVEEELASRPLRNEEEAARPSSENDGDEPAAAPSARALPGPVGQGIFVGSPADARGLGFERVQVIGMADQLLPGAARRNPLLEEGEGVSGRTVAEEQLDDLRALHALSAVALVTWPGVDPRTGREYARSRWIGVEVAPEGPGASVPSFLADLLSPDAALEPLSSGDRLLGELARMAVGGEEPRLPIERHPAVLGARDRWMPGEPPPLEEPVAAALSVLGPGLTRFEGDVGPGLVGDIAGELSPTRLETYAECPRRYLLERELRLEARQRPEATEEMDARERGSLIHVILADYIAERLATGAPASLERLIEIGSTRFDEADEEGRCGPPAVARAERNRLMSELRRFHEEDTLTPLYAELPFGDPADGDAPDDRLEDGPEPSASALPVGALPVELRDGRFVRFRGRIDRIDTVNHDTLVVSDYKTGRQRNLRQSLEEDPVGRGTRLQLAIYGLVAKRFQNWGGRVLARYWLTSDGRDAESLLCEVDETLEERLRDVVSTAVSGIEAGVFPGVPGEETYRPGGPTFENCAYCDFDRICPVDRLRRWAHAAESPRVAPVLMLQGEPPDGLANLVHRRRLDLRGGEAP